MSKAQGSAPPRVVIADASYDKLEAIFPRIIEDLDLASWYGQLKGRRVFIKPNMLGLFPPERHATTHPALVAKAVKFFRAAGAEVMVGDNCGVGGYGLNQRAAKKTGIMEAADGAFVNVAQNTVVVPLKSRFLDQIVVSRDMLEADVLVSLPKMKTHSMTVVTGAVKNMFGMVAGAGKGLAHAAAPGYRDFGTMLASIYALRPPDLNIMDAVVAMEGSGPSSGEPKPLGKILASTNAVALDAVMCRIMNIAPTEIHHIRCASEKGYGPIAQEEIEVLGSLPQVKYKLPSTVHRFRFLARFVNRSFFTPISRTKLSLVQKKCKQCRLCVEACPAGAMKMDDFPHIDEDKCIRCFCCHELCPEAAWEVKGLLRQYLLAKA